MAEGNFIITEIPPDGSPGDRFEWSADRRAPTGRGGARACPIQPWQLAGKLRTVRTDYPGARKPSEQVLGPQKMPFTLTGKWDDRYNRSGEFADGGYAIAEMRRFEALCERGNPCRFQYLSIVRDGLITEWDLSYMREWFIPYKFTVSVHDNPAAPSDSSRVPETTETPSSLFDKLDAAVQAMLEVHNRIPASQLGGTLADDMHSDLTDVAAQRESLGATLDNRELNPPEKPTDAFLRLATQFRQVRGGAFNVLVRLAGVRSDVELTTRTALSVLSFEDWSRGMRFMARIAMGQGLKGDRESTKRAAPDAQRLYRPQRGESLYAISRKFYGTPHAWRLIYERNALRTFQLLGTETLVIPDRGGT